MVKGRERTTKLLAYHSWANMIARCYDKNSPSYKNYGARGIKVCKRWKESSKMFLLDMGEKPSREYTLERIDNDKDYTFDNCKWATYNEQSLNKRTRKDNKQKGIRGLQYHTNGYTVFININKKRIYLGRCKTIEEARMIRIEAEIQYFGKVVSDEG